MMIFTNASHLKRYVRLIIFIFILCIVAIPRLVDLEHPSFTYDELTDYKSSIKFCMSGTPAKPISEGYLNGQLPFFISCMLYKVFGPQEKTARLLSVFASLLAICGVFLIVNRLWGFWWALAAMTMLGLSPFYISCSRLAFSQGHIFSSCLIPLSLYYLLKVLDNGSPNHDFRSLIIYIFTGSLLLGLALGSDLLSSFWAFNTFLAMIFMNRKASIRSQIMGSTIFLIALFLGVLAASPIYILDFFNAVEDILTKIKGWDQFTGYMWLGNVVDSIPGYYYLVVLLSKITPVVLVLILLSVVLYCFRFKEYKPFLHFLVFSLWPLVYLSLKQWKSPYYLASFIPIFFIIITDTMRRLFHTKVFTSLRILKPVLIISIIITQLYYIFLIHPDYLMLGIQYSDKLYGEFQGPAVSHSQWIGEALAFIKEDAGDNQPIINIFDDIGIPQIVYYARKNGLRYVYIGNPHALPSYVPQSRSRPGYIVINQDAKRLVAPLHRDTVALNRQLVSFAENSKDYSIVKTFYSGNFPMMWIYRRQ